MDSLTVVPDRLHARENSRLGMQLTLMPTVGLWHGCEGNHAALLMLPNPGLYQCEPGLIFFAFASYSGKEHVLNLFGNGASATDADSTVI